jgi:uncharacterized membrane protein YfhO
MLERDGRVEENNYFDEVHHYGNVYLLENNAWLPLGFLAENQLLNVDFSAESNPFLLQNDLFRAATGLDKNVWQMMPGNKLSITATDAQISPRPSTGYCYFSTKPQTTGTIVYRYTANQNGLFCVDLTLSQQNAFSVWKNGIELYTEDYSVPQSLAVSQVVIGDEIEIHLRCNAYQVGTSNIQAAILDESVFREGYNILAASTLNLTTFTNTFVEGTIDCNRDGVLYTSIPQDGNWIVTVDGKEAQTVMIGGAMIGVLLPEGEHTVSFTYHNAAFSLGWKISLVCLLILAWLFHCTYHPIEKAKSKIKLTAEHKDPNCSETKKRLD